MRLRNPRHRYEDILNKKRAPDGEYERALFVELHGVEELNKLLPHKPWRENTKQPSTFNYPYNVFRNEDTRAVLEAFLLSNTNDQDIAKAIAMEPEEVGQYRYLFFDTSVFHSDLELIVFIQDIPDDFKYKELFKIGFHQGFKALRWQFCRDKGDISIEEVLRTQMLDAHFRAIEHRGKAITGKIPKEARNYARFAISCAKTLQSIQDADHLDDDEESLRIKFKNAESNRTILDIANDPSEVLH
jgi:hypothetical protein